MLDGDGDAEESMLEFLFTEREDAGKARPKPEAGDPVRPSAPGSRKAVEKWTGHRPEGLLGAKSVRRLKRRGAKRARRGTLAL